MRSNYLVAITCCLLLSKTLQILALPTLPVEDSNLLTGGEHSTDEVLKDNLPVTTASNNDRMPTSSDEGQHTTVEPATEGITTNQPVSTTEEHATIASTKPTVICKDLEMNSSYNCLLGDIPFKTSNNARVHPINGIKFPSKSCKELYAEGYKQSGLYIIKPSKTEISVYCDMSLIEGGWTVIQRRLGHSDIFNDKFYRDYQDGFGDFSSSFWLGLDTIHALTASCDSELYVGLEWNTRGRSEVYVARYNKFCIGNEASGYMLNISGHRGSFALDLKGMECVTGRYGALQHWIYDSLLQHNNTEFRALKKNENANDCIKQNGGGWWYSDCYVVSNLNGHKFRWSSLYPDIDLHNSVIAIK